MSSFRVPAVPAEAAASPKGQPETSRLAAELLARIESRSARIGVIGLGYVGLPMTLTMAEKGFSVLGFDIDPTKIEALNSARNYIQHLDGRRLTQAIGSGRFRATADFLRLREPDVLLICVPTPLTPQRQPEMSFVIETARQIKASLRRGQLVVLESTTYPGTADELVREILETSGLKCGADFFLAFSPEREDPGNTSFATATIPKVVGGVDEVSGDLAQALYDQVIARTVRVSSSRAAEATKLVENIFRAVNIALVNELKMVFDRMGIDIWEVLDAASTKPFGFMRFNPGPGWGGHCIPLDPFYLVWKAREYGITPKFIELAGEVNVQMPHYVLEKLQLALNGRGKALKGSKVLVLGLAYKKDIDDARESPAFEILELLLQRGAEVSYHDPHVAKAPRTRARPDLPPMESLPLTKEVLESRDAALIVTDHTAVDYAFLVKHAPLVIDTRGVYRESFSNVVKA
ncbi:MAG TPA: nucleotide sugar dehydrogenase [Thermoanaerobaculia bacterium]|nr:nucleotide sugar dehydrogenase [Thermoanaerobaculia bacterium]